MSLLWFILGLGGWLEAMLGPVYLLTVFKRYREIAVIAPAVLRELVNG